MKQQHLHQQHFLNNKTLEREGPSLPTVLNKARPLEQHLQTLFYEIR
jgi:hypothetical protein